jgi:subtilisin-like proprotein convertase family protein
MQKIWLILWSCLTIYTNSSAQVFSGTTGTITDDNIQTIFTDSVYGLNPANITNVYGLKKVCINITHDYIGDLSAILLAPDGTTVSLFSNIGGGDDNFTNTCFDSFAVNSIANGVAPYTGIFRPQGNLGNVNSNQNGNGIWKLAILDNASPDIGTLDSWSLEFASNAPTPNNYATDIPLMVINTNLQTINGDTKSICQMKLINKGAGNLNYSQDSGNVYSGNIGLKIRGAYSSTLPQKSMSMELYDNVNSIDSNVALLGMPAEHDWILLATYNDKSFVRNPLMYNIFNGMGHYAGRSKYIEVILNGEFQGIYSLLEKIKRDSARLDIPKLSSFDTSGNNLTGGYIIQHAFLDGGWESIISAQPCNRKYTYNYEYPKPENILPQQANYIQRFVDTLEKRLFSPQVYDSVNGYRPYINVNSFVDYMLANEMSWNNDGYKKSVYFHKYKNSTDSGLFAGPIWDFDWALKRMPWTPTDHSGWYWEADPCDGDNLFLPWWNIMMKDSFFSNTAKCRWEYHRKNSLHLDSIYQFIDQQALYLQQAQQRHFDYWQTLGQNTGTPELAPFAQTYQEELDTLKSTIKQRIAWIDNHLPGSCSQPIFPVAVNNSLKQIVQVYPNPSRDIINVQAIKHIQALAIYDLSGQLILQQPVNALNATIDIKSLQTGLYLIRIQCEGGIIIKKINKL